MVRPICFAVMPFNKKPTGINAEGVPAIVDFDALWLNAFDPALRKLGYDPVRADQDTSALIIQEMLERLAASDLIVADLSIANANVYYEVGFRHGIKETGCVLIAAVWSRPLFDVQQMRRLTYPLPNGDVTGPDAQKVIDVLTENLPKMATAQTPAFQSIPGFPVVDQKKLVSFRDHIRELSEFQARVNAVKRMPREKQAFEAQTVVNEYKNSGSAGVALELLYLVRDAIGFADLIRYIDTLSPEMQQSPVVREQRALAVAKTGDQETAIGVLEELVATSGSTPEREGLLGGRYKQRYRRNADRADLDRAIEHYERGMQQDLNQYYCSSNLPRLLRMRNETGDEDRARLIAHAVALACERAKALSLADEWLNPTLLGSAFDAGDLALVQLLIRKVRAEGHAAWKLGTTLGDLESAIRLHSSADTKRDLQKSFDELKALAPGA